MSFSNEVKEEIVKTRIKSKIESTLELSAILKSNASITIRNGLINISFSTENEQIAKRIYKLLEFLFDYQPTISVVKNNTIMKNGVFLIAIEKESVVKKIIEISGIDIYGNYTVNKNTIMSRIESLENGKQCYIKGAFLGGGTIVDPQKSYHLEMNFTSRIDLKIVKEALEKLSINSLVTERKSKYILYIKSSETILDFLYHVGARKSMLKFQDAMIYKDIINDTNRRVNCDRANIDKVVNSSTKQLEDIYLVEEFHEGGMPQNLKEVARLRKDNPELSLKSLGDLFTPRVSKSSVASRLRRIKELADRYR